jgi:hypothetical protein
MRYFQLGRYKERKRYQKDDFFHFTINAEVFCPPVVSVALLISTVDLERCPTGRRSRDGRATESKASKVFAFLDDSLLLSGNVIPKFTANRTNSGSALLSVSGNASGSLRSSAKRDKDAVSPFHVTFMVPRTDLSPLLLDLPIHALYFHNHLLIGHPVSKMEEPRPKLRKPITILDLPFEVLLIIVADIGDRVIRQTRDARILFALSCKRFATALTGSFRSGKTSRQLAPQA